MEAVCPLCKEPVESDGDFVAHLAGAHGLVDDEGTQTTLDQAMLAAGAGAGVAASAAQAAGAVDADTSGEPLDEAASFLSEPDGTIHPSRIYDPDADSDRYRKVSIGLAGLLLIGAAAFFAGRVGGDAPEAPAEQETAAAPELISDGERRGLTGPDPSTTVAAPAEGTPPSTEPPPTTEAAPTTGPAPAPTSRPPAPPAPAVTSPPAPAPAPPPPPPPPPTTAPSAVVPTATEAAVVSCTKQAGTRTLRFSYVLQGSSRPDGRYEEVRTGRVADGAITVRTVRVQDRFGRVVDIPLQPAAVTCD